MNDYTNVINLDLLKNSSKVLSSLESCINNVDFTKYFVDLEDYIKRINFEHGSCISGYKEDIKSLIDEIESLKIKISHLQIAIDNTTQKFDSKQNLDYNDYSDLSNNYDGSISQVVKNNMNANNVPLLQRVDNVVEMRKVPLGAAVVDGVDTGTMEEANSNVTVIPPASTENTGAATTSTTHEINTIPIGLGIAATGITASVGAVIVDGMSGHSNVHYEAYKPEEEADYDGIEPDHTTRSSSIPEEAFESADAYHAARNKKSFDKFYGENNEYYEDEN